MRYFRGSPGALAAVLLLIAGHAHAAHQVLYDPELPGLPTDQGSLLFCSSGAIFPCIGNDGTQSPVDDGVLLQNNIAPPNENNGQFGYTNAFAPVPLDRNAGFTLQFDLQVNSESHANADRAGFSIIVLSTDMQGIELAFWDDEVWVQNVGFTHGEGVSTDTTTTLTRYSLGILDSAYTLSANGGVLFGGMLRDYSTKGSPYDIANFLFLGDDTTSAHASVTLGKIAFVPLPASLVLLAPALIGVLFRRRS